MVQSRRVVASGLEAPEAGQLTRLREELAELRERRERFEAEAADAEVVLRGLLVVRRAAEVGLTPELARLQGQVEKLIDRARAAIHAVAVVRGRVDTVVAAGHGDLVEATPALTRALRGDQETRTRFHEFVRHHIPPAAGGIQPGPPGQPRQPERDVSTDVSTGGVADGVPDGQG